ncbi:vitellogenin-A2-like [Asterias rubens]|uniref:vitellogenin-A2-like n=1 Tax=Asterias rubens TaxID=7604 RepID=UPI0014557F01|nr:vitellogenin-A2-like [Asterias rubens]
MNVWLLVLGFALANAATTIVKNNDLYDSITINRNSPEKYPTEFELGKTYRYNFTGDVRTSFPQTGNETIGQRINCTVEIVPLTTGLWNMRMVNTTVFEINGTHDRLETMRNSTNATMELRKLAKHNVTFQVSQGKIETIFTNKTEPEWITNIKKGILNMISLQLKKDKVYETDEEGVSGTCKTLYTVKETTNEDLVTILNVTKVRDLTNCTKSVVNKEKNFKAKTCDDCEKTEDSMDATATFQYNITGTKQRFIINQVRSDARYVFFPLGVKGGSISVRVNQTLRLFSVTEDPLFDISKEQESRGNLMYKVPEVVKVEEEMLNTVNKVHFMLKKLESQSLVNFTVDAPSHFILLVRSLTEANFNTLQDIWNLVRDKPLQRKWLIEALPYVNQEEMVLLIKELITTEETLLTTEEKMTLMMKIGTIRKPTVKSVEYLKDICEHRFLQWPHNKKVNTEYVYNITSVRYSCWRSLGVQINMLKKEHKYVSPSLVQSVTNCEKTFDKITKLTVWDETVYKTKTAAQQSTKVLGDSMTLEEAKSLLETVKTTKVREMCLVAMGQTGLPDFIPVIQPIIEQKFTQQTLDVRIAAVHALRRLKDLPNKVLSILLPVLRNPYEDSELRVNCYLVIAKTNQRPSVFTLIGQELNREKSMQVRSFIYTHLKFLAQDVQPCNRKATLAARYALRFTKPVDMGPTYSKVRAVRTFDQETKMGTKMEVQTIFSEGELTPKRTNLVGEVELFGKKTKIVEVEVKTSGMTNLLEKMLGHDGFFYKRKSVFDLLKENTRKRRSVSTNEEELLKINKKVSPYEVKPEEPRMQFIVSMFGNRINHLDINKDYLTTLIKEGKFKTDFSNLDEELAKKQVFNTTKGMMLMDQRYEYPTIMGLPLSFNTTVASIMRVTMNTTVTALPSLISKQESLSASFNITPEVMVNAILKMGVHTPLIKFGSAVNSTFNFTLPVKTNITIDFLKKKYELLMPQIEQNLTFMNFTHKMYNFWQGNQTTENHTVVNTTLTNRKPVKNVMCMEPFQDQLVCMNMTYVPRLGHPTSPFHPLTGPSHLSIFSLRKPMAPKTIKLQYNVKNVDNWEREKNIDIIMTLTGKNWEQMEYTNTTTLNFLLNHANKRIEITVRDTNRPRWRAGVVAVNKMGEEVDMEAKWGLPRTYTQKINNTDKDFNREYFLKVNSQSWTWNNTRNITMFWADTPQWLKNVTYITKTHVLPRILDMMTTTTEVDIRREPVFNPIINSTTLSLRVKDNRTMDVELHMPIEKVTIFNVTVPVNSSVLKETLPKAVSIIQRRVVEKYLSGNCTYNTTGNFKTYDNFTYNYNLTGSCAHVLTKDCSPNKRFTVLVQNTPTPNNLVHTVPIVTVFIENNKIELLTRSHQNHEVVMKFNGVEEMRTHDSPAMDYEFGKIERNQTHFTIKATLGLTVVYCKDNVTSSVSPWYVNKTCGLCGDFNGETFHEMKNTIREEQTNSTKFAASWLVHGDSCEDPTCKLTKEQLHPLPEVVYLANKPAACFSKEPIMMCPMGCYNDSPENIFTGTFIPTKQFIKVGYFCMASEDVKVTKSQMQARSELIKEQPVDLWRDVEVPHGCICSNNACNKQ